MAVKFNLLPPELSVSKNLNNALKTLRALDVIAVAVFLVFCIGLGVFFVISFLSLNNINSSITQLKSKVSAQESSEQQIVLLKDRLKKITALQSQPNALSNLTVIESFLLNLSPATSISQMQVDSTKIDLSLDFSVNSDLSAFLSALKNSSAFKSVTMSSFSFNPTTGYLVDVNIVKK